MTIEKYLAVLATLAVLMLASIADSLRAIAKDRKDQK